MTVTTTTARVSYAGNGSTTIFTVPWYFLAAADLMVIKRSALDVETLLALTTNYTVNGAGAGAGGYITLGAPPAVGETLVIVRDPVIVQNTDYLPNDPFPAESHERALDLLTMVGQRLDDRIDRSLQLAESDTPGQGAYQAGGNRITNLAEGTQSSDAVTLLQVQQMAITGVTVPLSPSAVGEALWPQTAAELAAGVTPTAYAYPPGDVRRYGADADGSIDDSAAVNTALSCGGRVLIPTGKTVKATNLTMGVAGTELVLEAGATLSNPTATNKLITVSGANCTISGPGRLLGPSSWIGTNTGEPTMAVLWVTGSGFTLNGATLENIYKCGAFLNDATNCRVIGNRFIGNFPYGSYGGTNTGHWAVLYDPPTATYADILGLVVSDNLFETCVQGVGVGNFGDATYEVGVTISGNRFAQCWDHGVYSQNGEGTQVTGNSFVDCHSPIVVQGISPVVVGNSLFATEPTYTNGQQHVSIRDAVNAVVTGNTIYGFGAGIDVGCVDGTDITGCVITDNTIVTAGAGLLTSAIRLGFDAETCSNNIIANNLISGGFFGEFVGAIQLEMAATFYGQNNVVRGNTIALSNKTYGILFGGQKNGVCSDNVVYSVDSADSPETHVLIGLADSQQCDVSGNRLSWISGGTNITARGIDVAAGCASVRLRDNTFNLSAPTTPNNIVDAGTASIIDQVTRGATASVTDGGTITHGHPKTPTSARVTASVASEFASVTAIGATTITVALKKHDNSAGTSQTVYWDVAG